MRGELLSWLMFVASGIGRIPARQCISGTMRPSRKQYALNRYDFEAERHWKILDARLARSRYMLGIDLHDRRHGGVGLGAPDPARHGQPGRLGEISQREATARRDQRPARGGSASSALRNQYTFKTLIMTLGRCTAAIERCALATVRSTLYARSGGTSRLT